MDGAISLNVRPGHKPKDLPAIDVEDVEADVYYRDKDGVIHLHEVKNTPKAFVKKLEKIRKKEKKNPDFKGQFERYFEWIEKGGRQGQVRKAMVYVQKSEPDFFRMIDRKVMDDLVDSIAKENTTDTIVQVENVDFNFQELKLLSEAFHQKINEIMEQTGLGFNQVGKEYFNSMQKTFETLGKTYGK